VYEGNGIADVKDKKSKRLSENQIRKSNGELLPSNAEIEEEGLKNEK